MTSDPTKYKKNLHVNHGLLVATNTIKGRAVLFLAFDPDCQNAVVTGTGICPFRICSSIKTFRVTEVAPDFFKKI